MKKLFITIVLSMISLFFVYPTTIKADEVSSQRLKTDLDYFFDDVGVDGYLVWLFSGSKEEYLENDPYSFYQDSPMCEVLKTKAGNLSGGKFLGVNIHSLSNHSADVIEDNLAYLSESCGTSVIRIWGSPDRGGAGAVKQVLDIAQRHDIRVIVAIADYSNSSGDILPGSIRSNPTSWYASGYKTAYLPYARGLAQILKGHPALFGYELANEPHCGGVQACVEPYRLWANDMANQIKIVDGSARVGIGQKASENSTLGDSPGPRHFFTSNSSSSLDFASAHYYTDAERQLATQAKQQADELDKSFYIGEAGFIANEIPSGTASTKLGPLAEGFTPMRYVPCDLEARGLEKEYHPLRPYPGSPCDPLIPRSMPEATLNADKKFNTFACGTPLIPETKQRFDPYGDNSQYQALGNINLPDGTSYAHTVCEPVSGGMATCYRTSAFDLTVDFSKANLGILGNTQDDTLTDEQKVNEYLSWYLVGTPQIGDQKIIRQDSQQDIDRVVNFSGPLRKLMPYELLNTARETLSSAVGDQVHDYDLSNNASLRGFGNTDGLPANVRKILEQVPFSSMEDSAGEIVLSVFKDSANEQQSPDVQDSQTINSKTTAPIKLVIKSATFANP